MGATKYADNKFFAYLILVTKFLTYNLSYKIIANAKKSQECVKKFIYKKSKVILLNNPSLDKLNKIESSKSKNIFLNIGNIANKKINLLIDTFYEFKLKQSLHSCIKWRWTG